MDRLCELLNKYSKCFSNNPGLTNLVEHEIQLVSDQPVRTKPYRMSHRRNEILKNEINRLLKLGIIEVGESDFMSPMILVEVAGKEPRPCIDYRKLNGIIRTEYFPLPNIEERVEKVSAAKFITVLDLSKGYWKIPLSKTAQRYATFCTSFGFSHLFRDQSSGCSRVPYPSHENPNTCLLRSSGLLPKIVNLFSVSAAPLTDALKGRAKKGEITWTTECGNAFRELKGKLIDKPVLYAPNFEREFIVQTDASNAEVEKRYCTTEKECASIVFAIKRLHYYLDGNSFLVMTDHNPLVWLNRNVKSNPRLMRWALALQPYNFRIVHRSGKSHKNADSLSRSVIDN
ncbi:retrovirus-related Pol polyprotein from transposon 297 [Trichonephila clavipes]|uniref:Retrovirus-related Pol polyprotein from transposon 297 n=1 Tax=Trichonephila clavipes TaxID=2585209 RepID=A0A8X6SNR9_TRICX|nr:retrovirus-related Pol polyprotein from transposon 297 [Trichonephila clavipes]